jgi:hypothetical protein
MNIFKFFKNKKEKIQRNKILQEYIDYCEFNLDKNVIYYFNGYLFDAFIIDKNLGCGILCRKYLLQNLTIEIYNHISYKRKDGLIVNYDQFKDIKLIPYSIIFKELMVDKEIVDESNNLYMRINELSVRNCSHYDNNDHKTKIHRWFSVNGTHDSIPDILNSLNTQHKYYKLVLDNLLPLKD